MSAASNYLEDKTLNFWFRANADTITAPATVYLALFTAVTDAEAGTGTEVAGGSYARTAITFGAPSNGAIANSGDVTFPTASADWGTVTHAAIFDASSSGNALTALTALAASKAVGNGDTLKFAAGDIDVTLA